jgi:DNA-binding PadR family transcriptional regulator
MTIRRSILAILDEGPCYGNQLRTEFERRTGGIRALNAGQVYATLDRLERDGLVIKDAVPAGQVTYAVTAEGSRRARAWLAEPAAAEELPLKLALASTLARADAGALVRAQRAHLEAELKAARAAPAEGPRAIVISALIAAGEAQLAWLDAVEPIVAAAIPVPIEAEAPKRGRPAHLRTAE